MWGGFGGNCFNGSPDADAREGGAWGAEIPGGGRGEAAPGSADDITITNREDRPARGRRGSASVSGWPASPSSAAASSSAPSLSLGPSDQGRKFRKKHILPENNEF